MNSYKALAVNAAAATVLLLFGATASATVISQNLSFTSQNQSMWGTGSAFQLNQTQFIGTTWNKSASAGGFVGGSTTITNPLWTAWNLCHICGSEPTHYLTVSDKTGLQVSASTTGKVGFNLGVTIDSGSLDALTNYNTQINVPTSLSAGESVSLNASAATLESGSLNSQFPTMSASLSAVVQASANFAATGCAAGACASGSISTGTIGGTQQLVSFNQDGSGGIEYFGGTGPLSTALDVAVATGAVTLPTGFPATLAIPAPGGISDLGTITAYLPQPNVSGGLDATGTKLTGTAADNLLDFSADVDNLISVATTGVGGLFGGNVDMGAGFSVGYDLVNVEMGPQIDLRQTFDLTPTLYVDLQFSQPVNVTGYGSVTSIQGLDWNNLPTMAFSGGATTVTPTFYLGANIGGLFTKDAADLVNQLMLDIGGNIKIDMLDATFSTPFGGMSLGLGNLLDESFNLFTTPPIFNKEFAMAGFNSVAGNSFEIDASVPEPGTLLLLGGGLLALAARRRKRT